ncbi:MAG: 4-hydroxy-tetrahydrodipicolinate reductase [Pirellulales bacterium]|nr:4-hydroxy-tetrahydrodipicolinate reductase [Pirellulales bacterium]
MSQTRIAIHGAAGRMGQRLVALAAADPELLVVAALDAPSHPRLGEDAGTVAGVPPLGVPLAAGLDVDADVVIDFSLPEAAEAILENCLRKRLPLVTATTGFDEDHTRRIHAAAEQIPILWAPNMSLAVNLTMKLAEMAAGALRDKDADVEILERHHRFKEDSPSGTALKFGRIIAQVMGQTVHRHGREGRPGKRSHGEIGYHAVRVGDNPGEHTIVFAMLGEMIELTVRATSRDCYATGALAAAKFLAGKPPGRYGIDDVLGL